MAQAAVSDVAGHWPATAGQWLLAGRSEKTLAGGSSSSYALLRVVSPSHDDSTFPVRRNKLDRTFIVPKGILERSLGTLHAFFVVFS